MTRNLDRRVEVIVPIYDEDIKKKIVEYMDIQWKDNTKARIMNRDGIYEKIPVEEGEELINSQEKMMELATLRENKIVEKQEEAKKEKLSFMEKIKRFFGKK